MAITTEISITQIVSKEDDYIGWAFCPERYPGCSYAANEERDTQ